MVFHTAGGIAALLIGFSGQTLAQYYPPPQVYPRQPPPQAVEADELPPLNAPVVQGNPLPPVGVGPDYQSSASPGARDPPGISGYPGSAPLPPNCSPGYQGPAATDTYYELRGAIP